MMKNKSKAALLGLSLTLSAGVAQAGNIYLTGHDVFLHSGQGGYDNVILEYLRNGEGAAADYDIGFVRGFSGGVGSVGFNTLEGFGSINTQDLTSFADSAAFTSFLSGIDVLVIPSHTACGGCDLSTADADILESFSAEITDFFNAGGDIFSASGATDSTFYNFLPGSALASGAPISGSSGFTATTEGVDIGITNSMINGFQTHNRFFDIDTDFTVFETRGSEIISIGLLDGIIDGGGIGTDPGTDPDPGTSIPEPGMLALMSLGLVGVGAFRRKKA
jgi:hypothetical protein